MNEAEILWIKSTQRKSFPKEYEILTNNLKNMNTPYISQFGLYIGDEGIIRCKGRINNSPLATNSKNPVFMPSKDDFVHLLIRHVHNDVKHSGLRTTLTVIRERFWILRGRASVKRIINKCVICRRYEGVSLPSSLPPDLPEERVADDPPFTHTGLDFAGPLYAFSRQTKESTSNVEQSNCEKYYVLLFTCASTRAVHLELTQGVSVSAFLLAIRRFASRRGLPATILSDNAKTFKAANKELQKIIRSKEVERFLAEKRISWRFIVERAPWWGGFWERLVRSVKRPLKKVVGKSTLSIDELQTILIEIEAIINSRPITYVYGDDESGSYPLTPSDLIYGRRITSEPNSSHYEVVSTNQALTRRVRHQKSVLKQLTSLWRREYLTSLREQATAKKVKSTAKGIMKGDVVIVKKESTPRAFWKIAIVEELIPSADGIVRAATIKMSSENGKNVITRRSVQHLVPLEVNSTTTVSDQTGQTSKNEVIDEQPTIPRREVEGRTRRTAAVVGELARRLRK